MDSSALHDAVREQLIAEELLRQEAVKRHIDQTPGFRPEVQKFERDLLLSTLLKTLAPPKITDEQVREVYNASIARLDKNDFLFQVIVVNTQTEATSLSSQLARGADFDALARVNSRGSSAKSGGTTGWVNMGRPDSGGSLGPLPGPVVATARGLAKGGISVPVSDGASHWWIVKLDDSRPAQIPTFDAVAAELKASISAAVTKKAARDLLAGLKKSAVIQ
jgi:parvulin-like peptidyl-prolyl isomerase